MAMGFGGIGLLSGMPMFQQRMGGGMFAGGSPMFPGGQGSFVGASQGFVGARPGGLSTEEYFANEQERQRQQLEQALQRRAMKQAADQSNRELSLKEMLANHQMSQDQAATGLARDRLGLDANVASADANQRANALGLQERLGWAGENRMSAADQQQNERANQQLSLQERLGLMSEGRLAHGQEQDEAFRRAQLGQQAQLAHLPYQRQTADSAAQSDFQNRQLGQQDRQFNRQFTDMPLADRWRNQLAEKQQQLDQSNTDRAFNDLSARDRQTGSLEEKRMGMTERLAGNENQLRRDLQGETLKQQLQMWNGLSAAEKQQNEQFGKSLAQNLYEFNNVSGNNRFATESQKEMHDDTLRSSDWFNASKLTQDELDRTQRGRIADQSNATANRNVLLDFVSRLQGIDPDVHEKIMGAVAKEFGGSVPQIAPNERATLNMARQGVLQAQGGKPAATPREQSQQNIAGAQSLGNQVLRGELTTAQAERIAAEGDKNTVGGAATMLDSLRGYIKEQRALEQRNRESNFFSKDYVPSSQRGMGK